MSKQLEYEGVEQYLRTFSIKDSPQGFGGLLRLVLAGIENLRENVSDGDVLENAHSLTDLQAQFLQRILDSRAESIEWYKDYIGHSSHTGLL